MVERWIGKEGVLAMAVAAMFLLCSVPTAFLADGSDAQPDLSIDDGTFTLSDLLPEASVGNLGDALVMLDNAFPMDIGSYLRLFAGHFEEGFALPDGIEDQPGTVVLDRNSPALRNGCSTLILKDGARLNLSHDLEFGSVIIAGNAVISAENGCTLSFDRLSFGNLAVYDNENSGEKYEMSIGGKALFDYSYAVSGSDAAPTVAVNAAFSVDGGSVTVTQYRDVLKDTEVTQIPLFGIFTDWIYYTETHTVMERGYTVDTYRANGGEPVCSFTLEADPTESYSTLSDYFDGVSVEEIPGILAGIVARGLVDLPDIETRFSMDNMARSEGHEILETYDYDFGIWKQIDGFEPKTGCHSIDDSYVMSISGCAVSLVSSSDSREIRFEAGLGSADIREESSDGNCSVAAEDISISLGDDGNRMEIAADVGKIDVNDSDADGLNNVLIEGSEVCFAIDHSNIIHILHAVEATEDIDLAACLDGVDATTSVEILHFVEHYGPAGSLQTEDTDVLVRDFHFEAGADVTAPGSTIISLGEFGFAHAVMSENDAENISVHTSDVHISTSAGLGTLAKAVQVALDYSGSDEGNVAVEVVRTLIDSSGFNAYLSIGSFGFESTAELEGTSNRYSFALVNSEAKPSFVISSDIRPVLHTDGFEILSQFDMYLTEGSAIQVSECELNGENRSISELVISRLSAALAEGRVTVPLQDMVDGSIPYDTLSKFVVFDVLCDAKVSLANIQSGSGTVSDIGFLGSAFRIDMGAFAEQPGYFASDDFRAHVGSFTVNTYKAEIPVDPSAEYVRIGAVGHYLATGDAEVSNQHGKAVIRAESASVDGVAIRPSTDEILLGILVFDEGVFEFDTVGNVGMPVYLKPLPFTAPVRVNGSNTLSVNISVSDDGPVAIGDSLIESIANGLNAGDSGNRAQLNIDTEGRSSIALSLSGNAVKSLADKSADLEIQSGVGSVNLGVSTLQSVLGVQGSDVALSLASLEGSALEDFGVSSDLAEKVGDSPVIAIDLSVGGNAVHNLNGTATITVPYDGGDLTHITVYYLNPETNCLEAIKNAVYDPESRTVTFTTTHFSMYSIGVSALDDVDPVYLTVFSFLAIFGTVAIAAGVVRLISISRESRYPY